jgi:hypothetical protein
VLFISIFSGRLSRVAEQETAERSTASG